MRVGQVDTDRGLAADVYVERAARRVLGMT